MFRLRPIHVRVLAGLCVATLARPAAALDLAGALADVAAHNPTLAARAADVEAARAEARAAGRWPAPMLELGFQNLPTSGSFDMDPMTMKTLGVRQSVPLAGRAGLAARAGREGAEIARRDLEAARITALAEAIRSYSTAYEAAERARAARAQLETVRRMAAVAEARWTSGGGGLAEIMRARSEVARAEAEVATNEAEAAGARAQLDALRGIYPGTSVDTLEPPAFARIPTEHGAWAHDPFEHPELRAGEAEVRRLDFESRSARRSLVPDLELMGEYGFREGADAGMPREDMVSARVGLALPLFGGRRPADEASALAARKHSAERALAAQVLDHEAGLQRAHAEAIAAERRVRLLADTVVVSDRRALEATWAAYTAGTLDLGRVFDSARLLWADTLDLSRAREARDQTIATAFMFSGRPESFGLPASLLQGARP